MPHFYGSAAFSKASIAMVAAIASASFSAPLPAIAQEGDPVIIETTPLSSNLYMLSGQGGNMALSTGPDGVFLVDDELEHLAEDVQAAIAALTPDPVRFVINTHWHSDHTGGNELLGNAGAIIFAHEAARQRMETGLFLDILNFEIPASSPDALPIATFDDSMTFHLNGDTIRVIHFEAAHTDGDVIVHWQNANVIHAGDIYASGEYPFIDTTSRGSVDGTIAAVDAILAMANNATQIIPGDGTLSNRAELLAYRDMLLIIRGRTEAAIAQGMSIDEYLATAPSAEFDPAWNNGFITPEWFIRSVYKDLSERHLERPM